MSQNGRRFAHVARIKRHARSKVNDFSRVGENTLSASLGKKIWGRHICRRLVTWGIPFLAYAVCQTLEDLGKLGILVTNSAHPLYFWASSVSSYMAGQMLHPIGGEGVNG
jgi:hypothetical protein